MKPTKTKTVDSYLAALDDDKRAALEQLRATIRSVMPRAEECISYGIPAFRSDGRMVVWYGASAKHCSFYPGAVVQSFADELRDYQIAKGTIRFAADERLPTALVRKLIRARLASIVAREEQKRGRGLTQTKRR
jgi:uncharacterized protein YdhG (YjbR/CyaY superfamily)